MAIIKLEPQLINKIAAGEVVERPVSVVKELFENALDAGAKNILVEIKDGGQSLIRVRDDGCGIDSEELHIAFMRHATSKIKSLDDLEQVMTMGFRGEALCAISSVSEVEIITKTELGAMAARLEVTGGIAGSLNYVAGNRGTDIYIRNLFYNVPARRKFLKKPAYESAYISEILEELALCNPQVAISFINNGRVAFKTTGTGHAEVIGVVFGPQSVGKMLDIEYSDENIEISGHISKPEASRNNRSQGHFFLNGRVIKSDLLHRAVMEGYDTRLPKGRFPMYSIHLTVDPRDVDVNVHPTKQRVRFAREFEVYESVRTSVIGALSQTMLIPSVSLKSDAKDIISPISIDDWEEKPDLDEKQTMPDLEQPAIPKETGIFRISTIHPQEPPEIKKPQDLPEETAYKLPVFRETAPAYKIVDERLPDVAYVDFSQATVEEAPENHTGLPQITLQSEAEILSRTTKVSEKEPSLGEYSILGRVFGNYWLVEQNESLFVVDQHAAHERIMYEGLLNAEANAEPLSQMLLTPAAIRLNPREAATLTEHEDLFLRLGFEIEEFGENTFAVRAIPYILREPADSGLLQDLLEALGKNLRQVKSHELRLQSIALAACKAAVRSGDKMTEVEARELIRQLFELENPFNCPHGRPTIIEITKSELSKKFLRTNG